MKVKIIKSSSPHYWYSSNIGDEFTVVEDYNNRITKLEDELKELKKDIKSSEDIKYAIGSVFKIAGVYYILSRITTNTYNLIGLESGNRFKDEAYITESWRMNLTQSELKDYIELDFKYIGKKNITFE